MSPRAWGILAHFAAIWLRYEAPSSAQHSPRTPSAPPTAPAPFRHAVGSPRAGRGRPEGRGPPSRSGDEPIC
eukprot:7570567-Alexandrium_andersonii.AAC.1